MTKPHQVAVIGEVLWDVFPDQQRLGGAPANFSIHLARLARQSAEVNFISAVGEDPLGNTTAERIEQLGLSADLIQRSTYPTGRVNVTLENGSPQYEIAQPAAWDEIQWSAEIESIAQKSDAVCFGTLAQRSAVSRQTIEKFIDATSPDCLRMLDINLRPTMDDRSVYRRSLELANMLKLSDEELPVIAEIFDCRGDHQQQLKQLAQLFDLRLIAYTQGGDGATLIGGDQVCHVGGVETTVVDTVGAGDSFTATLVWEMLQGHDLETANIAACKVAAFVCSQIGATPKIPDDIYAI